MINAMESSEDHDYDDVARQQDVSPAADRDVKKKGFNANNFPKAAALPSSSSWSRTRLKDPRIVRVSRAFGGKDRHSKVCTVRGLRDRRVRLSVPTAIQLYDLQDRLGLNQPSKVVDWLLNAAKNEIDELPPLQMPPSAVTATGFNHNLLLMTTGSNSHHQGAATATCLNWDHGDLNLWPNKPAAVHEKANDDEGASYASSSCNDLFSRHITTCIANQDHSSYTSSLIRRWDHNPSSALSLSQTDDLHNFNVVSLAAGASTVLMSSMPSGPHHHQVLVYQPAAGVHHVTQSYFPNSHIDHIAATSTPPAEQLFPTQNEHHGRGGQANHENEFHSR